jgi:hypothetical protein
VALKGGAEEKERKEKRKQPKKHSAPVGPLLGTSQVGTLPRASFCGCRSLESLTLWRLNPSIHPSIGHFVPLSWLPSFKTFFARYYCLHVVRQGSSHSLKLRPLSTFSITPSFVSLILATRISPILPASASACNNLDPTLLLLHTTWLEKPRQSLIHLLCRIDQVSNNARRQPLVLPLLPVPRGCGRRSEHSADGHHHRRSPYADRFLHD